MENLLTRDAMQAESVVLSSEADAIEDVHERIENAFSDHCVRDMLTVRQHVLNLMAQEIKWLNENEPNLSDLERRILAKKLIQQRIRCYLGAIEQIQ